MALLVCFVGADISSARCPLLDQTAWQKPGGPKETRKPQLLPCQGPVARKERGKPLKFCPPEEFSCQRGRKKRRFGSFAAAGKGTRRRGGGTLHLRGCAFLSDQKGTKESPGDAAIGPAASRPVLHVGFPPDPHYGGRFPEDRFVTPARVVTGLPPLPRRCRWPGKGEKAVRLDEESAPVATSRRGWSVLGGRRNAAPTQRAGAAL